MDKKNLGAAIESEFKENDNNFNLTKDVSDDQNDIWWTGSFDYKGKTITIFAYEGVKIMMAKITYSSEIKAERTKEIDIYKITNKVNDRCPGFKCVLDDYKKNTAYLSFNAEIVSNKKTDDLSGLSGLLNIIILGDYYFKDEMSRVVK